MKHVPLDPGSERPPCPAVQPSIAGDGGAGLILGYIQRVAVHGRTTIVGLCGAQGSGKSTAAAKVAESLRQAGWQVAVLSLDDLYVSREERADLAARVHPLFRARGVPGTHDPALGEHLLESLSHPGVTTLPRFDKAADTIAPADGWSRFAGPADIVLFEGWCVGARPQRPAALAAPVNALERDEDPDGTWRRHANMQLAGAYARLFGRLDQLILLAAPDFEVVIDWRQQQERQLRGELNALGRDVSRTMDDAAVERFVRHYERLTRHILAEMPRRASMVIKLDARRRVLAARTHV